MKNDNLKLKVASGILLIIIGFGFLISDYVIEKREKTFTKMNVELNELLAKKEEEQEEEQQPEEEEQAPAPQSEEPEPAPQPE